jgi:hypothetical protein
MTTRNLAIDPRTYTVPIGRYRAKTLAQIEATVPWGRLYLWRLAEWADNQPGYQSITKAIYTYLSTTRGGDHELRDC